MTDNIKKNKDEYRISQFISKCGIASRRKAEELVLAGRIKVNGEVIENLATKVTENDIVEYNNTRIMFEVERLFLYYKQKGEITSYEDDRGRVTIFEQIERLIPNLPKLLYIGRLDYNSEGLLLLTTSHDFHNYYINPRNKIMRKYEVKVFGDLPKSNILYNKFITYQGINYKLEDIRILASNNKQHWLEFSLYEGKNREIRNICEYFGLTVSHLLRTEFGDYSLGDLRPGELVEV